MQVTTLLVAIGACLVGWALLALAGLLFIRVQSLSRVVRAAGLVYLLVAGGEGTLGAFQSVESVVAYRGVPTAFFGLVGAFLAFGLFWPWWLYWQMAGDA